MVPIDTLRDREPSLIAGVGAILAVLLFAEVLAVGVGLAPALEGFVIGIATTLPFLAGLLYGGYWLDRSDLPASRYRRILLWTVAALVVSLVVNAVIMVALPPEASFEFVSWVRWAAAIGAAIGLAIGVFEARAIHYEVSAERERLGRKQLQAENERLEEFASIVSHDLRNPLNVAQGRLDLARQDVDSEDLEEMAAALERMDDMIEDLLSLARDGRVVDSFETVPLEDVVRESWETVDTGTARLELNVSQRIRADPGRLKQLLENLVRNAIEHGGADVTVSVGDIDNSFGFYLEDDGTGISSDDHELVFKTGYTTADHGTGFGLAIVRKIAEAHGWSVTLAESEQGGTRFEFTGATRAE